ncbi:Os02g0319900 [Oryza sativa Japonica Group]|uniref:Os02g0319900 protein n=1 Tax=Oryza sativa subsp. japonica TaxID=39947 RepID=A0A0P0VIB7_ORYSJ|nr:Os02g0319900 [Oryza sativa Japonica Group]
MPDHQRRLPQSHTLTAVVAARDDLGSGGDSDGGRRRLGTTSATTGGSGGVRWRRWLRPGATTARSLVGVAVECGNSGDSQGRPRFCLRRGSDGVRRRKHG